MRARLSSAVGSPVGVCWFSNVAAKRASVVRSLCCVQIMLGSGCSGLGGKRLINATYGCVDVSTVPAMAAWLRKPRYSLTVASEVAEVSTPHACSCDLITFATAFASEFDDGRKAT